ncbi:MAG: glucose-6-phosphate isomerase [Verrucomicrobiales bacterium]|nr:glucose-6-phosphate isomerase [Verrucomicrobiales bacterium]
MSLTPAQKRKLWKRLPTHRTEFPTLNLSVDLSRVDFPAGLYARSAKLLKPAFGAMKELEQGTIANPDEERMVGHYWLRNPALAPNPALARTIRACQKQIKAFAASVHSGKVRGQKGRFDHLLVIGIGGSALGPQFVANALGHPATDKITPHFFDNTDPDGIDRVLAGLKGKLGRTLVVVISKSGGTKETANGMLEAQAAYRRAKLDFARHFVAVTGADSDLDKRAIAEGWLERFPMWDWVGGRTSQTAAVGLLPAALQGFDIDALLKGAAECDKVTRTPDVRGNPSAQLALMWHWIGGGRGAKDMVLLPYKDRLELLSRYLQQLVMESLGKELDRKGRVVNQGIAVYGNKGSTDQHAYVQQLREGLHNFFVTFIEVLKDRDGRSIEVEPGITTGDYLSGFLLGTRDALYEKGRQSITLTVDEVSPFAVGVLIALFERAVGLYATMVNINAYHQPGVQAGKLAAGDVLKLQQKVVDYVAGFAAGAKGAKLTAEAIAAAVGAPAEAETVFKICERLSRNPGRGIQRKSGTTAGDAVYRAE